MVFLVFPSWHDDSESFESFLLFYFFQLIHSRLNWKISQIILKYHASHFLVLDVDDGLKWFHFSIILNIFLYWRLITIHNSSLWSFESIFQVLSRTTATSDGGEGESLAASGRDRSQGVAPSATEGGGDNARGAQS